MIKKYIITGKSGAEDNLQHQLFLQSKQNVSRETFCFFVIILLKYIY